MYACVRYLWDAYRGGKSDLAAAEQREQHTRGETDRWEARGPVREGMEFGVELSANEGTEAGGRG